MSKSNRTTYEFDQSPLYCLRSKAKLSKLLRVSRSGLKVLAHSDDLYIERDLFDPKRQKSRRVEEPKHALKQIQKRLADLLKRVKLPDYIHAPGKGYSYISNAKAHANALVVRSLDIEKYFPSTPARRVYWFFHTRMKCSEDVAGILTKLSTFKDHLPTGSPLSPLLSYFSHIDMWESINQIVEGTNCKLTVYMDDVTISGTHVSDNLIWQVKQQFYRCGLRSNKKKEKHYIRKKTCEVTGIIIKQGELKIPNRQHFKIYQTRQALCLANDPEKRVKLMRSLEGLEAQVEQIKQANRPSVEIKSIPPTT